MIDNNKPGSEPEFTFAFPPVIRIEPSASCNLACAHCPTGTVEMARGIMKPEVFQKILPAVEKMKKQVRTVVMYHGGEPLLNRQFGEMVAAVKKVGISNVKTVSNGMMLLPEKFDRLIDSGIDIVEFSLDGRSREENNFIRRKSDFDTVVRNVKGFLDRILERGESRPKVYLSNTQFLSSTDPFAYKTLPKPPEFLASAFGERYWEMLDVKTTWAMQWPEMGDEILDNFNLWIDENVAPSKTCSLLTDTVTVRWNGDVVACCYDLTSKYVLGNIGAAPLEEIWNNSKYRGLRKSVAMGKPVPLCKGCNVLRPPVYLIYKPQLEERFEACARQAVGA